MSFLSEGLLLIFHLKGPRVEVLLHLILGLQVFATGAGPPGVLRALRGAGRTPRRPARLPVVACGCLWLPVVACGCLLLPVVALGLTLLPLPSSAPLPAVVAVLVELAAPSSILAASARPWLTMLQVGPGVRNAWYCPASS